MANNLVSFYHFNTEEAMNQANLKDTDIAFCTETKVIKTHGVEYGRALEWNELEAPVENNVQGNESNS